MTSGNGEGPTEGEVDAASIFDVALDSARGERTVSPAQIEADGGLTPVKKGLSMPVFPAAMRR